MTGKMFEQGQVRDLEYVDEFEYEDGLVSRMKHYDLTHFMFNYEIHYFYDAQRKLIRKEGPVSGHYSDYHYEDGRVVNIYIDDDFMTYEWDISYDDAGNITHCLFTMPVTDMIGWPIPGEFETIERIYEYDDAPRPNFGIDHLFGYQPIPWLGDGFPCEIMNLSDNNMTKAIVEQATYNYTYNEYGLPETLHNIYDPSGPSPGRIYTITYKRIEETGIPEIFPKAMTMAVYPNPAADKIVIGCDDCSTVMLYDMLGREVLRQSVSGEPVIDISYLPEGVYIVRAVSEGRVVGTGKVVKQ
jgi:hypothetical protein